MGKKNLSYHQHLRYEYCFVGYIPLQQRSPLLYRCGSYTVLHPSRYARCLYYGVISLKAQSKDLLYNKILCKYERYACTRFETLSYEHRLGMAKRISYTRNRRSHSKLHRSFICTGNRCFHRVPSQASEKVRRRVGEGSYREKDKRGSGRSYSCLQIRYEAQAASLAFHYRYSCKLRFYRIDRLSGYYVIRLCGKYL